MFKESKCVKETVEESVESATTATATASTVDVRDDSHPLRSVTWETTPNSFTLLPPPASGGSASGGVSSRGLSSGTSSGDFSNAREWSDCFIMEEESSRTLLELSYHTVEQAPRDENQVHEATLIRGSKASLHTAHKPRSSSTNTENINLEMAKIKFDHNRLYGRQTEQDKLRKAYQGAIQAKQQRTILFVSGVSGVGKSSLVENTLQHAVEKTEGARYCQGKYDYQQQACPYPAITQACRQLLTQRLTNAQKDELRDVLGMSIFALSNLLPTLLDVVGVTMENAVELSAATSADSGSSLRRSTQTGAIDDAQNRFIFAVAKFVSTVTRWGPLVMVLDDLQWADTASIHLLQALMSESTRTGRLVVVGCYRSNQLESTHALSRWIRDLKAKTDVESTSIVITQIFLSNLDVNAVNEMLAEVLHMADAKQCADLAMLVQKKTFGNPFFVIQYLKALQEQKILTFNLGSLKWSWDVKEVEAKSAITENVVDIMRRKFLRLSNELREILPLAACLGATFDCCALRVVVNVFQRQRGYVTRKNLDNTRQVGTERWLETCVKHGFIINQGDHKFSWVHDKIQEAVNALVKPEKMALLEFRVGEILFFNLNSFELSRNQFVVANLLNKGGKDRMDQLKRSDRLKIAKLNLEAGRDAVASASFTQAVVYLQAGIGWLPENHWVREYDLSLELFSLAAEVESVSGDTDAMFLHCQTVIDQSQSSTNDKFRAYFVLVGALWSHNRTSKKSLEMCVDVLSKLGCRLPRRFLLFHIILGIGKMQQAAKSITIEMLNSKAKMRDRSKLQAMKLLDKMVTLAYFQASPYLPLSIFKGFHWTIEYGISEYSGPIYALAAMILMGPLKDLHSAKNMAETALLMVESSPAFEGAKCRTMFIAYTFVLHAFRPMHVVMKKLFEAYGVGLSTGDVENAAQSIILYLDHCFFMGKRLETLDEDWSIYNKQLKSVGQERTRKTMTFKWQVGRNLLGLSRDPLHLKGDVFDIDEFDGRIHESIHRLALKTNELHLYYTMCDDVRGADAVHRLFTQHKQEDMFHGSYHYDLIHAQTATVCYGTARKNHQRKYLKYAKKCHKHIKFIGEQGNTNFLHMEHLLDGEYAALKGRLKDAKKCYIKAIALAARQGLIHEQAVAHERFGDYMLECGDVDEAEYRWNCAMELCSEWGAGAKVDQLRSKVAALQGTIKG